MSLDTISKNNNWIAALDRKNVDLKEDKNGNGISDLLERIIDIELSSKDKGYSVTGGLALNNVNADEDLSITDSGILGVKQADQAKDITKDPAWLEVHETVLKNIEAIEDPEMKDLLMEQLNEAAKMTSARLNYQG